MKNKGEKQRVNLEEPWDGKGGVTGWVGAAAVDTLGMVVVMVEC